MPRVAPDSQRLDPREQLAHLRLASLSFFLQASARARGNVRLASVGLSRMSQKPRWWLSLLRPLVTPPITLCGIIPAEDSFPAAPPFRSDPSPIIVCVLPAPSSEKREREREVRVFNPVPCRMSSFEKTHEFPLRDDP